MTDFATKSTFTKTNLISPISYHIEWNGGKDGGGYFHYYDKANQTNEKFDLKDFIVLKTGYCVRGFVESINTGVWSNEISDLKNEDLIVQSRNGVLLRGKYDDIKEKMAGYGLKLWNAITVLHGDDIIGIYLKGAASMELNKFLKSTRKEDGTWQNPLVDWTVNKISFVESDERKKGAVTYFVPTFEAGNEISPEEKTEATLSSQLVVKYYDARKGEQSTLRETPKAQDIKNDNLPF